MKNDIVWDVLKFWLNSIVRGASFWVLTFAINAPQTKKVSVYFICILAGMFWNMADEN